jgi:pilus assembly protein CpaE
MYPLPVLLIGNDREVVPHVRQALLNHQAEPKGEFRDLESLLAKRDVAKDQVYLCVVHVTGAGELERLQRLTATYAGAPVLALVGSRDSGMIIKAMRAGATQVVPLPLQAEDFKEALDCISLQFGRARATRIIAFSGTTGGCGVTTAALNFAYELAHQFHKQTVLVECALQMGMLEAYLDANPRYTIRDLLDYENLDSHAVQQALTPIADNFHILTGPRKVKPRPSAGKTSLSQIIELTRVLAEIVVVDLPPTLDEGYFKILMNADQVHLLFEQKIPSIRNVQMILDVLPQQQVAKSCQLVINRYDPRVPGFTAKDMEKLLRASNIQTIASDPVGIDAAANQGRPLRLEAPRSAALADIGRLVQAVVGAPESSSETANGSGIVKKLMRGLCLAQ